MSSNCPTANHKKQTIKNGIKNIGKNLEGTLAFKDKWNPSTKIKSEA